MYDIDQYQLMQQQIGFAVSPKMDCPHIPPQQSQKLLLFLQSHTSQSFSVLKCQICDNTKENWICAKCLVVGCSRYVKSHMAEHNSTQHHPIALSFSDASFWCYECDSYIERPYLKYVRLAISHLKHPSKIEGSEVNEEVEKLAKEIEELNLQKQKPVTYEEIIQNIKNKEYKNVVVLSGAGLSVAAGIPDFRSPGTGLYSKLQKYNLPYPQAIFTLSYFRNNPEVFLTVAKEIFGGVYQPTIGHKLIVQLQKHNLLLKNLTQNIDDLQIKAGLSEDKLMQAHGHSRSVHCIDCHKEVAIKMWQEALNTNQVLRCECKGLVKPDIIFFGEALPKQFEQAPELVKKADLVFIIGTSLKVMPFAFLAQLISETAHVVLMNREDCLSERKNKVWLKENIDESSTRILNDLGWN